MIHYRTLGIVIMIGLLAGCSRQGEIDSSGGIVQVRSACPRVAVPAYTGDVTLFNPPTSTDARAIDVVGAISNVRANCDDSGDQLYSTATFTVTATRADASSAREVVLPYFSVIVRGSNAVVAKRVGQVRISFAPGEARASVTASAASYVDKSAATLPPDVQQLMTKRREPGDPDAAVDPLSLPQVRDAIARTSFEMLVGFNLTQDQLRYNATR